MLLITIIQRWKEADILIQQIWSTSGAYTVDEINDDSIVYTARDDYYRGTPSVKKLL